MAKYKNIKLNMRSDTLEKLIMAYLSGYAPSRASAAEMCSVSKVTSGKVANALLNSGFMTERIFACGGGRPSAHLFFRVSANILLVDLSSSVFKISICNALGQIKFHAEHEYDTSISPDDNLNIFISRCGIRAKKSNHSFNAISVIYADINSRACLENDFVCARLPQISDTDYISNVVYDIFGMRPIKNLTVSETISEAIRFKAHGITADSGISYVFIGDHISLFHVYPNSSVTVCSPQTLLDDDERKSLSLYGNMTKDDADRLFIRLCSFMGAAFSPSSILLESDKFSPDRETSEKIIKKFALANQNPPIIYTKSNKFPLCVIGAVRSTLFKLVKNYITASE